MTIAERLLDIVYIRVYILLALAHAFMSVAVLSHIKHGVFELADPKLLGRLQSPRLIAVKPTFMIELPGDLTAAWGIRGWTIGNLTMENREDRTGPL